MRGCSPVLELQSVQGHRSLGGAPLTQQHNECQKCVAASRAGLEPLRAFAAGGAPPAAAATGGSSTPAAACLCGTYCMGRIPSVWALCQTCSPAASALCLPPQLVSLVTLNLLPHRPCQSPFLNSHAATSAALLQSSPRHPPSSQRRGRARPGQQQHWPVPPL